MTNNNNDTFNFVDFLILFENGELSDEGTIKLFQHIVDSRADLWLQGYYGRTARDMIEAGLITARAA